MKSAPGRLFEALRYLLKSILSVLARRVNGRNMCRVKLCMILVAFIHQSSAAVLKPVQPVQPVLEPMDTDLKDPFSSWLKRASSHACKAAVSGVCSKDQTDKRDPILGMLARMTAKDVGCSLVVSSSKNIYQQ